MYIELRHLRTIRAIQQAGGLARAADMLNMTQSALSQGIAELGWTALAVALAWALVLGLWFKDRSRASAAVAQAS